MTRRTSLREFQDQLARRLKEAEAGDGPSAQLSFESGGRLWLVGLADAGEVLPMPAVEPVPLTRAWFVGVANLRGVLYGVSDFAAFLGGPPTPRHADNRLLLVGQPTGVNAALLVARLTGLRNPADFVPVEDAAREPWVGEIRRDRDGALWHLLDPSRLLAHRDFLEVAQP